MQGQGYLQGSLGCDGGDGPAGISRKHILGRGISRFHDLVREEWGKKEAVSELKEK